MLNESMNYLMMFSAIPVIMIHAFQDIMFDKKQHDLDKMRLLQANLHNLYIKVACRTNIIVVGLGVYYLLTINCTDICFE